MHRICWLLCWAGGHYVWIGRCGIPSLRPRIDEITIRQFSMCIITKFISCALNCSEAKFRGKDTTSYQHAQIHQQWLQEVICTELLGPSLAVLEQLQRGWEEQLYGRTAVQFSQLWLGSQQKHFLAGIDYHVWAVCKEGKISPCLARQQFSGN